MEHSRAVIAAFLIVLGAACAATARAQGFPFEDAFTAYAPGSAGGPAWSILDGAFTTSDGALRGPVTIRYNARMPDRFTARLTVLDPERAGARVEVRFNHQHETDTRSADGVAIRLLPGREAVLDTFVEGPDGAARARGSARVSLADAPLDVRVVVDASGGRFAVWVGDRAVISSSPMEYAGGLFSITLDDGAALDRVVLRAPEPGETSSVRLVRLLNDPRDVTGSDGALFVLHRGSPAVLAITADGEVTRAFGRRAPGAIPDAVALERGTKGEVLVLNRVPGEVVVFERNGGIRHRFGRGSLVEPADMAVGTDGTVYVADPGAKAVIAFRPDGNLLGTVKMPDGISGTPERLAVDPFANLVVAVRNPDRVVVVRPTPDRLSSALVSSADGRASGLAAREGRTLAYWDDAVITLPDDVGAPRFQATAVGGLKPGGRLGIAGDRVYAVDRENSRVIAVPDSLKEAAPAVSFLNVSQSAAVVAWSSDQPSREARVRVTWGGRSTVERTEQKEAGTLHEVPLRGLRPDFETTCAVWPTLEMIPPVSWSIEYPLFSTSNAVAPPSSPAEAAK